MMRKLAENLWVVDRPLSIAGVELGARMTVVRLGGGSLLLVSPVAMDEALRGELQNIGPVAWAVAPNRFHHLFLGDCRKAFPGVQLLAAPGLAEKRRDLVFDAVLPGGTPAEWQGQLDLEWFGGTPLLNEVVFLHRASRTLLLCDLAFHMGPSAPLATRLAFRLAGGYGRLAPTRLEKLLVRDRAAARASLARILAWDFDRVVVTHGEVLEHGGREALRAGYAWLQER